MNSGPLLLGLGIAVLLFGIIYSVKTDEERRIRQNICILKCQTPDVVVQDGRCGCITWKD